MTRSWLACGCMIADAFGNRPVDIDRNEVEIHLAGLDLGEIEKVVDEAHHMRAGRVDVLQIVAIALVADRPEALLHDDFSKAEDSIERRADFVADLGQEIGFQRARPLGLLARVLKFLLNLLPMRHVTEKGAEFLLCRVALRGPDAAEGHEDRNMSALMRPADDLAPVVEQARDAVRLARRRNNPAPWPGFPARSVR